MKWCRLVTVVWSSEGSRAGIHIYIKVTFMPAVCCPAANCLVLDVVLYVNASILAICYRFYISMQPSVSTFPILVSSEDALGFPHVQSSSGRAIMPSIFLQPADLVRRMYLLRKLADMQTAEQSRASNLPAVCILVSSTEHIGHRRCSLFRLQKEELRLAKAAGFFHMIADTLTPPKTKP